MIETFRLIVDAPAPGAWNMAVDEVLLENADRGACAVRFYQWSPATLSLGYFQKADERAGHEASRDCPLVRRPSGGGAILHDRELTYGIAVPNASRWGRDRLKLYDIAHRGLIDLFAEHGAASRLWSDPGPNDLDGCKASRGECPFLCFERRTPGDVVMNDSEGRHFKVVGSAQRRSRDALLQHGSILLDRSPFAPELPGVNDLSSTALTPESLAGAWIERLQESLDIRFEERPLDDSERTRAERIVREKYGADAWTIHKGRSLA